MKRTLFAIAVGLVLMCGAEVRVFADPPTDDDGGGCTSQPCLGPSNPSIGQSEESAFAGTGYAGKRKTYLSIEGAGLISLGEMRGPERVLRALRVVFGRLW